MSRRLHPIQPSAAAAAPAGAVPAGADLEAKIAATGRDLGESLDRVVLSLPGGSVGPAELGRTLGVDKVLASRVLKALRHREPLAIAYHVPGPEPMRRFLRQASRKGAPADLVAEAEDVVRRFEQIIRQDAGDRAALNAIISAWLPEARAEFELRSKQAAFRAMSQLKGAMAETSVASVMLHPSADGEHLDVLWITGLLGLHRLRPGAGVKFATRRITDPDSPRRPTSLDGVPVDDLEGVRLDDFCSSPPPALEVHRVGEVVHYTLAENGFGPQSAVDLVFAEANLAELPRYVPADENRKGYVFAEVSTPARVCHFDAWIHEDVYPRADAQLSIYDTAHDGVASVNDRARDIDRLDLLENVQSLGQGLARCRTADVPHYAELMRHVCDRMGWDGERFRGYRCRIDFPVYGSQVTLAFDVPADRNAETPKRRNAETPKSEYA